MHVINKFRGLKSLTLINCGIATIEVSAIIFRVFKMPISFNIYGSMKMKLLKLTD